ncbi:MAG TPA: glycosyltransferase [Vicinamibacteria bacterium]|jgi:dolichol-phosphate mannosyltransferase|nr:glycosyltransferase [Vicinamibacteria bacterium]
MIDTTLVFVPTYDERENVERLITEILELGLDLDLLFLDDNSPDGTGALLDALALRHRTLSVIHRGGKLGIGSAHLQGIAWAYAHGYRRLVTMDADFTHPPSYLKEFLLLSAESDVVVGSRYLLKNSLEGWTLFRRILTYGGHLLTRTLLGLKEDASSAYRLYRLDRIPSHVFSLIRATGYSFFFESLYVLRLNGFSIREVPIVLPARASGQSKMGFIDACQGLLRLGRMCVTIAADRRRFLLRSPEKP